MFRSCWAFSLLLLLGLTACHALALGQGSGGLVNPAFESTPATQGWEVTVYGARPQIERDSVVLRNGHRSLRISSEALTDTALGQEIRLKPAHAYRLQGWVKTRALNPGDARVCSTFQIQLPGGKGIVASGANQPGDRDWTKVTVPFLTPADGRVRICLFFVGFGKGTGTVWFDSLQIEEVNMALSPILLTREPLCSGEISPFQYGQFIEYLCDLVPGMWAEKLYDGSFEGLSPYKFVYLKETDFKEKPWYPSGATNRAEYSLDKTTCISGEVSQQIAVSGGPPCTVGISQDGIALQHGTACRFTCFLRQKEIHGPVNVRVHEGSRLLASAAFHPTGDWRKYESRLIPAADSTRATLSIEFQGPGILHLDNASLMPENTVGGWRRDVVDAIRALKPGIIRFGGSALDDANLGEFQWADTIGDPDKRRPFRAWGGLQPTGPGLEEIVQLCQAVGSEPLLCVRTSGTTPQSAAEEVEYFNGGIETPFGALRAKNGHAKPYGVRYWQVGNERSGPTYESVLADYCRAMRRVDPCIRLLSSYPTVGVLRNASDLLDYVCPHHYGCADLTAMQNDFDRIRQMIATEAPGRKIRVGVTEWNTTAGDAGPRRAMLWTLENALDCARYHNLLHRDCDLAEIANRSNLTNSFCSGILQTDRHRLYKTPTYYAQQLYATLAGNRPLRLVSDLPSDFGPDISATLSPDGTMVTLFAVNSSGQKIVRPLDLSAWITAGQTAEEWLLTDRHPAGEPDVANSFEDPERIAPVHATFPVPTAKFTYAFPAYSLTVLRWRVHP